MGMNVIGSKSTSVNIIVKMHMKAKFKRLTSCQWKWWFQIVAATTLENNL